MVTFAARPGSQLTWTCGPPRPVTATAAAPSATPSARTAPSNSRPNEGPRLRGPSRAPVANIPITTEQHTPPTAPKPDRQAGSVARVYLTTPCREARRMRIVDRADYWDTYAKKPPAGTPEEALKHAFGWTQYRGHGPGDELLGDPLTALELGSGHGDGVAALSTKGIDATGVDLSPAACEQARQRWGHLPGARYVQADVVDYLTSSTQQWDAIYSIWGAAWFTDPQQLLPRILGRLTPGGRLVFAQAPAVPGSYGAQGMFGDGFKGRQTWIYRWAYEPETWADILRRHGYSNVRAWVEPAPEPDYVGTLIATARKSH